MVLTSLLSELAGNVQRQIKKWIKLPRFCPTYQAIDFILKYSTKNRCDNTGSPIYAAFALSCGQSDPILKWDLERRPIPTVLELPVEVVQQVAHELMGVLLLIAPETWHDFPYGIKQGVWTEGGLVPLPQRTKGFPELLHQRPDQQKASLLPLCTTWRNQTLKHPSLF